MTSCVLSLPAKTHQRVGSSSNISQLDSLCKSFLRARYSFIQLNELGSCGQNTNAQVSKLQ